MGDPLAELQQRGIKRGLRVQHLQNGLGLHGRLAIVQRNYHAGEPFVPKRNQHTRAHQRLTLGDAIGERHVQRDRQSNVAEQGHGR